MKASSVHEFIQRGLVVCVLVTAAAAAWGQTTGLVDQFYNTTPLERAEAQAEVLADVLGLDGAQVDELVRINLKYSKRIQTLIDQGASDAVLYHEIQKHSRVKDDEILSMLTNDQKDRYAQYKARLRRIIEDVIQRRNR
jgi:hypothetical protein